MITTENLGRLGNACFLIASLHGLAKRYKAPVCFPKWEHSEYLQNPLPEADLHCSFVAVESNYHHDWIQWDHNYDLFQEYDVNVIGYLQNSQYFEGVDVHKIFELKPDFVQWQRAKFAHVFEKQVIAISIRRGDYVNNPNYYLLPIKYYIGALLHYFPDFKKYNVMVFSDDYEYCKFHFGCLPNVYYAEGTDIEDHALMRECDHFILANSTFSYWGAYLGQKPHSKVIRPNYLFAGRLYRENGDTNFFENEDWEVFDHVTYKIDLDDTTFLIPVFNDSPDRDENVNLCVKQLKEDFRCKILIGENKTRSFTHLKGYNWFNYPDFHRTRILNKLTFKATTPIIANWDGDVFVAPMQILETVKVVRKGADMVYPYDGSFARVPRTEYNDINKFRDLGTLAGKTFVGMNLPVSVGGAVFFNKQSFFKGGMENENFISYGPEDRERYERFEKLGFTIKRIPGTLYHIDHKINKDSSTSHEYYNTNAEELSRIQILHPDDLKEEVEKWDWSTEYYGSYYEEIQDLESPKVVYRTLEFLEIPIRTIIDIGCGGQSWKRNDYTGIDYLTGHDIRKPLNIEGKFDLTVFLETIEHILPQYEDQVLDNVCKFSNYILFSGAIPGQGGENHHNEQWQSYWADKMAKRGFYPYLYDIREWIDVPEVKVWYKNNIILYTKVKYEVEYSLDKVHIDLYKGTVAHYQHSI